MNDELNEMSAEQLMSEWSTEIFGGAPKKNMGELTPNDVVVENDEIYTDEAEAKWMVSLGKGMHKIPLAGAFTDRYMDMMPRAKIRKFVTKNNYLTLSRTSIQRPVGMNAFMSDYVELLAVDAHILKVLPDMMKECRERLIDLRSYGDTGGSIKNVELPPLQEVVEKSRANNDKIAKLFNDDVTEYARYNKVYRSNSEVLQVMDDITELHSLLHHNVKLGKFNDYVTQVYSLAREIIDNNGSKSALGKSLINQLTVYSEAIKLYAIFGYRITAVIGSLTNLPNTKVK